MKAILLKDINSYGKQRVCYGAKGECLQILARRDNMLILKGKRENFPVNIEDVQIV